MSLVEVSKSITVYFRPKYTISKHNDKDIEVTITIGPDIEWGM